LTIAARLGEPSAVLVAAPGSGAYEAALPTLAAYGATKVYRVESADVVEHLVAPTAEVLAQLVERTSPAAVLVPSSAGVLTWNIKSLPSPILFQVMEQCGTAHRETSVSFTQKARTSESRFATRAGKAAQLVSRFVTRPSRNS